MTTRERDGLSAADAQELERAVDLLENQGLAKFISNLSGKPFAKILESAPKSLKRNLDKAVEKAIFKSLHWAVGSLDGGSNRKHFSGALSTLTGGLGGLFGAASLPVELPVSTVLILRAIAEIAQAQGEDIKSVDTKIACIEVLALAGPSVESGFESSYYKCRKTSLIRSKEAAHLLTEHGMSAASAPAVSAFMSEVATRFGAIAVERAGAGAIPLVGALTGAAGGALFTRYFQDLARGHFIVRRLERHYGAEMIEAEYRRLLQELDLKLRAGPVL